MKRDDLQRVPQIWYLDRAIIFIPSQVSHALFHDKAFQGGYYRTSRHVALESAFQDPESLGRVPEASGMAGIFLSFLLLALLNTGRRDNRHF